MSYYVCKNEQCENYNKHEEIYKESFKYANGEIIGEHAICPKCGKIREYVNPASEVPLSEKLKTFVNTGSSFSSASKEQKQEILRKRAHEHFNKSVKERKDYLMNKAMTEMRSLGRD